MRTVIDLRDDLVERAKKLTGLRRKVDVVNEALRLLVEHEEAYRGLRRLRGRIHFARTGAELLRERHGAHR
jgi:Arc/MetJ family transcription regulator